MLALRLLHPDRPASSKDIFDDYDKDKDGQISLNELAEMFLEISNKITTLPPTAQVANQQGVYLGKVSSLNILFI